MLVLRLHALEGAAAAAEALAAHAPSPGRCRGRPAPSTAERVFWWRDQVPSSWDDAGQEEWLAEQGVELVRGDGVVAEPGRRRSSATASSRTTSSLIATGSVPSIPPIAGLADVRVLDEPRGDERERGARRASSSSAAARSAASSRRSTARLGARVTLVARRRAPTAAPGRRRRRSSSRDAFADEGIELRFDARRDSRRGRRRRALPAGAGGPGPGRSREAARRHRPQAERRGLRPRAARPHDLEARHGNWTNGQEVARAPSMYRRSKKKRCSQSRRLMSNGSLFPRPASGCNNSLEACSGARP